MSQESKDIINSNCCGDRIILFAESDCGLFRSQVDWHNELILTLAKNNICWRCTGWKNSGITESYEGFEELFRSNNRWNSQTLDFRKGISHCYNMDQYTELFTRPFISLPPQ
ncbi:MAG: hypothetical protein U5K54_11090 [Cytophagales bacterium]|nr:hypothetical protein [Cytophagales bacterium]